jgi:hypothetical protein
MTGANSPILFSERKVEITESASSDCRNSGFVSIRHVIGCFDFRKLSERSENVADEPPI